MTTSPVMQALLGEKLRQEPSAFGKWCIVRNVRSLPAMPAHIAAFIADLATAGKSIKQIWPLVQEISAAHLQNNFADPTAGGVVSATINSIALLDPPRSWPATEKQRWKQLPYDLQCFTVQSPQYADPREHRRSAPVVGSKKPNFSGSSTRRGARRTTFAFCCLQRFGTGVAKAENTSFTMGQDHWR
jgi:hypothetical protein